MDQVPIQTKILLSIGIVVSLIGLVLMFLSETEIVYAIEDPDSISIESIEIFRNFIETDDELWIIEYNIAYAINPSEDSRLAFYAGISDGTTIFFTVAILNYDYNFISIYLTAAQALTWEGSFFVHISGNLGIFTTLTPGVNQVILAVQSSDWNSSTETDDVRTAVGERVLLVVTNTEINTGIDYITDGGLLSTLGGNLVEATVPNAREYITSIFSIVVDVLAEPTPIFTQNYQATLEANRGPRLDAALEQLGSTILGKSDQGEIIGTIGFLLISITILGTVYATTKESNGALVVTLPLLWVGNEIGIIPLALMFVAFTFIIVLFSITFILSRVG